MSRRAGYSGPMGARGRLGRLVFGAMAAEAVFTAVRLRIADLIGDEQRDGTQLAAETGTDVGALTRLLRALAALDLMSEPAPAQFRLTEAGQLLRSDHPDSMHAFVRTFGDPTMLRAWRELGTAVRSGESTYDKVNGASLFEYLASNPEVLQLFTATMRQGTVLTGQQLVCTYDVNPVRTVADVGGGDGTLLAALLKAHPHLRGILFDTADGLTGADRALGDAGVADRCECRAGDFFAGAPEGADLYMLKSVLRGWDDARAGTILAHIRAVIPDAGRLLIIEPVLPDIADGSLPATVYLGDLNLLVSAGTRLRSLSDYKRLCELTGFTLRTVTRLPLPFDFSVLEAAPTQ